MRKRDYLFEAVIRVAGWEQKQLTDSARGSVNKAVREIREVGGTPDEVIAKGRRYWTRYPNAKPRRPSPATLARHWPALVDSSPMGVPQPAEEGPCEHLFSDMDDGDERGRYCPRCKTWQSHAVQLTLIEGEMG